MNMLKIFYIFSTLAFVLVDGLISTIHSPLSSADEAALNKYVDLFLPGVKLAIKKKGMDPLALPNIVQSYRVKPLLIAYTGNLELTNGTFRNLLTIKRSGNVGIAVQNNTITYIGNFAFTNISFDYNYLTKIMNLGPDGKVYGSLGKFNIRCEVQSNTLTKKFTLSHLHFSDTGKLTLRFTENSLIIDWLTNALINVITTLNKRVILLFVETTIRLAVQDIINDINVGNAMPQMLKSVVDKKVQSLKKDGENDKAQNTN